MTVPATTAPTARPRSLPVRVLLVVRDAVWGVVDEFLLDSFRQGRIRLKGHSPAVKAIVLVVGAVLVVTFLSFASGDLFRTGQDLLVLPGGRSGRGTFMPAWLVPVTFFLLTVGLALLVAGALHSALAMRIPALVLATLIPADFLATAHATHDLAEVTTWPGWVAVAAIPVVFAVRWRAAPRPGVEFTALLLLLAVPFGIAAHGLTLADELAGSGFALRQLDLLIVQLTVLAFPLVFVSGMDVLAFGVDASAWSLRFVDRRIGQAAVVVGVVALGLWRVRDVIDHFVGEIRAEGVLDTALPVLGAALLVAAIGGWWLVVRRLSGAGPGTRPGEDRIDQSSVRVRLSLAVAFSLVALLQAPLLLVVEVLVQMEWAGSGLLEAIRDVADVLARDGVVRAYRVVLGAGLLVVGALNARAGRRPVALLIGAIAVSTLLSELYVTSAFDVLFAAGPEPADAVWLGVFLGLAAWWAGQRRFSEVRSERILFALVLGALVAQFDFVSDPFGPLLGFTGVGFVIFGLTWGFLTGGGVTNTSTPGFPRSTRVYLYLGYSLLSIALLHWSAVAHDLAAQQDIGQIGQNGVEVLGYPLIYAVFALVVASAVADRPIDEPEPEAEPEPEPAAAGSPADQP